MSTTNKTSQAAKAFVQKWSGKGYEKGEIFPVWFVKLRWKIGEASVSKNLKRLLAKSYRVLNNVAISSNGPTSTTKQVSLSISFFND